MRKIGDIHVFEDQAFLNAIKRGSIVVFSLGVLVAVFWGLAMTALRDTYDAPVYLFELDDILGGLGRSLMGLEGGGLPNLAWWLSLAVACFATLVLHELVHAFFFKQYAPPGTRISFGANAKMGMMYASADGVLYPRSQYIVIVLAPTVVVTLLVLAVGMGLAWPMWTIIVATAHLSGCTGDWEYVRVLRRDRTITHCRDTEWGVEFYGRDHASRGARRATADGRPAGRGARPGRAGAPGVSTVSRATGVSRAPHVAGAPGSSQRNAGLSVVDGGRRSSSHERPSS